MKPNPWESFENNDDLTKALCGGGDSWICQCLMNDARLFEPASLLQERLLQKAYDFLDTIKQERFWWASTGSSLAISTTNTGKEYHLCSEVAHRLNGLCLAMKISRDLGESKGKFANEVLEKAKQAIQFFDASWGVEPTVFCKAQSNGNSTEEQLMSSIGMDVGYSRIGYWVLYDLLISWAKDPKPTHVVSTPILAAGLNGIVWLTVELFEEKGGAFVPDLRYLGLTCIGDVNDKRSFHASIQYAWRISGLGEWFRGRWRLTGKHPNLDDKEAGGPKYLTTYLKGPSAGVAFLVAMLSASGDPYGVARKDGSFDAAKSKPETLATDIGVSAALGNPQPDILQTPVNMVSEIPVKASSAIEAQLITVLLAEKDAVEDPDLAIEATAKNSFNFKGKIVLERIKTVGDALDAMLVTNRHLRVYQSTVREQWLRQWEKGTARLDGDDAPGPDDQNLPSQNTDSQDDESQSGNAQNDNAQNPDEES